MGAGQPPFMTQTTRHWRARVGVKTLHMGAGSEWENGCLASLSGGLRDELLDVETFDTPLGAQVPVERGRKHSNTMRSPDALRYRPWRLSGACTGRW